VSASTPPISPAIPPKASGDASPSRASHFRAYDRRPARITVTLSGERSGAELQATVIDISLAGAGIETEEALVPGERVALAFATPTLWDPLIVYGVVAWSHPPQATNESDAFGRPRKVARAGVQLDYPTPAAVLAIFELIASIGFE
jgi:hypothetical protein